MSTYQRHYGERYNSNLRLTEIAQAMRADIKGYKLKGELPRDLKVSVRCEHGTAIRMDWKADSVLTLVKVTGGNWHGDDDRFIFALNERGIRIHEILETIHGAYNYDGSDVMTDYFDVRYYGRAEFDSMLLDRPETRHVEGGVNNPVIETALVLFKDNNGYNLQQALEAALLLEDRYEMTEAGDYEGPNFRTHGVRMTVSLKKEVGS